MTPSLLVGARGEQCGCRVVDSDEREDKPRRVVGGKLLIQDDLLGNRHPAAPFARPVRYREARTAQLGEPPLLERDELLVADIGLRSSPVCGDVLVAPRSHRGAELVEAGRHVRVDFRWNAESL